MRMSDRAQDLAHKRESLRLRAASQRAEFAYTVGRIEQRLGRVDHTVNAVRRFGRKPLMIGLGAAALALIGPRRLVRWSTRSLLAAGTARRMINLIRG